MSKKRFQKRIKINKTEGEWLIINAHIKNSGKRDFNTFMQKKLFELSKKFNEDPESIPYIGGDKTQKIHYINPETYKMLNMISFRMQLSESVVVDKLIITPLLHNVIH